MRVARITNFFGVATDKYMVTTGPPAPIKPDNKPPPKPAPAAATTLLFLLNVKPLNQKFLTRKSTMDAAKNNCKNTTLDLADSNVPATVPAIAPGLISFALFQSTCMEDFQISKLI